jgi:hypothetical protein
MMMMQIKISRYIILYYGFAMQKCEYRNDEIFII